MSFQSLAHTSSRTFHLFLHDAPKGFSEINTRQFQAGGVAVLTYKQKLTRVPDQRGQLSTWSMATKIADTKSEMRYERMINRRETVLPCTGHSTKRRPQPRQQYRPRHTWTRLGLLQTDGPYGSGGS